ncbi:hypothetical protein O6H91_08G035400 [Diphasiastrum complanatum]|uniref:Uncharacterized protein n=1 Tax=Diphasiastrum complanatum TaxID=34168 RepID=A0ACC2CWF4_DIPCM|nr:hypothetical protein O6H91_08G035400 [Diphasiastrum complanatum]
MPSLSCNSCNAEFPDEASQRLHYRSEWHRHNLKRKVAGVPGVTEALFNSRVEALAAERKKAETERMLYKCPLCAKEYTTVKAHAQHLQSKLHISKISGLSDSSGHDVAIVRTAPSKLSENEQTSTPSLQSSFLKQPVRSKGIRANAHSEHDESDSSDEWEEVDAGNVTDSEAEVIIDAADVDQHDDDGEGPSTSQMDIEEEWDVTQCFICDARPDGSVEGCIEHLHKVHGFFLPDAEYLKDPSGLLNYLGLKVTKGFMCLYCSERGRQYQSIEAVRKHMVAKCHCKLPYEDGESGIEELEDFYDFSSSFGQADGSQVMAIDHLKAPIDFGTGGFELIVKGGSEDGIVKTIGTREFSRYYRQRPKPADLRDGILVNALVASCVFDSDTEVWGWKRNGQIVDLECQAI